MKHLIYFLGFVILISACSKTIDNTGNCTDGIKNQGEQETDCGGPCPVLCENCGDGIKNQGETAVDCGGPCDPCYPRLSNRVNNMAWYASSRNAFMAGPGMLRIYGTNQQTSITLHYSGNFGPGTVTTGNNFTGEYRSANGTLFTSQPGGKISITTFDTISKTVSGTYQFIATDTITSTSVVITDGVFNVLEY